MLLLAATTSQTDGSKLDDSAVLSAGEKRAAMRALGITDAQVERAQRAMGYVRCLYGTTKAGVIVGLPEKETDRPSFLAMRREACAHARYESELAFIEQMSFDKSISDSERTSKVKRYLDRFDQKFEENVLRPEVATAQRKALEECIDTKGTAHCF